MLDYARPAPGEATDRAVVMVTFLRMDRRAARRGVVLPPGAALNAERMALPDYRALYEEVGTPWLWWLRRAMPDDLLARHLAAPSIMIHLLRVNDEIAGFFETDTGARPDVNLNYFGLCPKFVGRGLGRVLLDAAVDRAHAIAPRLRAITLNTCTADHPRALPNYLAAGFTVIRRVEETWDVPRRLGLAIPAHVRG